MEVLLSLIMGTNSGCRGKPPKSRGAGRTAMSDDIISHF